MKKIYSDIIILLAMLIAAPTSILAQTSGSVYVGYAKYDDQIWEYDGLSLDHDAKVGCAILLTKEMIAPYAGGTITGMRVGWDTSSMTGTYEGFVRTSFNGEDLTTGKATVKYSYSDANPGWNNLTLKEYVIPADVEQLVVGFTTTLKKDVCAIPMLYPYNVANSCYLWVEGDTDENGDPLWYDMKERGILPILLIVKDTEGKFSYVPVISLLMPDGVVTAGTPADCLMRLKNLGSQTIRNIEVTSRQGEQTYSKKVTLSKTISTGTTSSAFLVPLMSYESGDVELSITKVNDKELAEPVGQTLNVIAVPKDVAAQHVRRPLVEYYESENNYRSARYYDEIVAPSLEGKENRLPAHGRPVHDGRRRRHDPGTAALRQRLQRTEHSRYDHRPRYGYWKHSLPDELGLEPHVQRALRPLCHASLRGRHQPAHLREPEHKRNHRHLGSSPAGIGQRRGSRRRAAPGRAALPDGVSDGEGRLQRQPTVLD